MMWDGPQAESGCGQEKCRLVPVGRCNDARKWVVKNLDY